MQKGSAVASSISVRCEVESSNITYTGVPRAEHDTALREERILSALRAALGLPTLHVVESRQHNQLLLLLLLLLLLVLLNHS